MLPLSPLCWHLTARNVTSSLPCADVTVLLFHGDAFIFMSRFPCVLLVRLLPLGVATAITEHTRLPYGFTVHDPRIWFGTFFFLNLFTFLSAGCPSRLDPPVLSRLGTGNTVLYHHSGTQSPNLHATVLLIWYYPYDFFITRHIHTYVVAANKRRCAVRGQSE